MRRLITPAEWTPRGIKDLEPNADEVVRSAQNILVTAGPGAGKTELLAQRASFLLETGTCAYPRRILAISFKRDAAKNLRDRVQNRSGSELSRRFDSYTFDAFAKGILDQFRAALPADLRPSPDYEILFQMKGPQVQDIVLSMEPPDEFGTRDALREFETQSFFSNEVPRAKLKGDPENLKEWAAREFWRVLIQGSPSRLSFAMISRLAGHLLLTDPRLLRAYRATYSHVFLDEFQDTTGPQYWLTKQLFRRSSAVLTAVGDPQQRIMGWAGALPQIFSKFEKAFAAMSIELQRNYRASEEIAPVVRYLAGQLGTSRGAGVVGKTPIGPPAEACAAHIFADEGDEAEWIADEIDELLTIGIEPREIGVLVRMRARDYGERVIEALDQRGRSARVEDKMQDLLSEPIIEVCVLAFRALATDAPGRTWAEFRDLIAVSRGFDLDDERKCNALEQELSDARQSLRADHPNPPNDAEAAAGIVTTLGKSLLDPIRRRYQKYLRGPYYSQLLQRFAHEVAEAAVLNDSWSVVLDKVEGRDAVPILTIHKSKGLEYHAVFFVGLEDGAFWNFRNDPDEESNAFYVALSRAKKRVVFSFARRRTDRGSVKQQSVQHIQRLYDLMEATGVETIQHDVE